MTLRNLLLSPILLIAGIILIALTNIKMDEAMSPKLIYQNKPLPSFRETQDYTLNRYAPMVRLETKDGQFFCSGTVISDDYVLTAAHCLVSGGLIPGIRKEQIRVVSNTFGGIKGTVMAQAAALNTRADYGLVKGNFKEFTKAKILTKPDMFNQMKGPILTCGFPWGATAICYPTNNRIGTFYSQFVMGGRMFPGMSGGPVLDIGARAVVAVNTGVVDGGIILSPLIGLFETLGVEVVQ